MLPSITPDDFRLFLDGTGKPFTEFLDSVLRANAAKLSISPGDVHTNIRVNVSDGGVDTQVDSGNDPDGRLAGPTLWQYKARRFADMTEALVREEIHGESKGYARELITKGYGYRLCICEDTAANAKLELQEKLNEFVREVNPAAPPALILLPSDLAPWANHFPAVIAQLKRIPVDKFRYIDSWKSSATAETPVFIPTEHFAELKARIEAHIDWTRKPGEKALTIFGDAGVGKSRSVFEILSSQANQREIVIYTSDEQAAIAIATALANDESLNAILVADECLSVARFQLMDRVRGVERRIRLITIDNARERTRTLAPELQVQTTEAETLRVLEANFPNVAPARRQRYAAIAKGFPRFAVYMCSHDSEISESGSLSSALGDAQSYYEYLFSGRIGFDEVDREAVEIVALLNRVGYREDRKNEVEVLCQIVGRSAQQVRERIEKVRTRTGLISSAGRFYYVTPTMVAMIAFNSAWARWIAPDPESFLKQLPEELIEAFQDRVATASSEVGAVVARFFREWIIARGPKIFESESDTRRLVALVVADPQNQVPLLRSLVEAASADQLRGTESHWLGHTPRRLLISLAEELAQFEQFFLDAEAILFRLAIDESETSVANNATRTWKGLFLIFLSGTEVPFQRRNDLLRRRFDARDPGEREMAVLAAATSVDQRPIKLVGPPLFGTLVPPQDWRPGNTEEYFSCIGSSIDLMRDGLSDPNQKVASTAQNALLDAAAHLLWSGMIAPVRASLEGKLPDALRPRMAAMIANVVGRSASAEIRTALQDWMKSLESTTLHDRLIENLSVEPWSHHFDEAEWRNRVNDIAHELYDDSDLFEKELEWLTSKDAKGATELGHFFGRLDAGNLDFLKKIFDAALERKADAFARGYVYGVSESPSRDSKRLNEALDRMQAADPQLAFYVMLPAGDNVNSFNRAMSMVADGPIPPRLLANLEVWVGNRKTTAAEARAAVHLLVPLVKSDRQAGDTAIDFVAYQINRVKDDEQSKVLFEMFGERLDELWMLMEEVLVNPGRESFWYGFVLKAAARVDPVRASKLASLMLVSDDYQFSDLGQEIISELATKYPNEVMEVVGEQMTQGKEKQQFFFRKFPVLSSLPLDVVVSWLERVGVLGAQAIARHLEPPTLDGSGQPLIPPLTQFVLTRFEDDDRTFSEFVAGVHSFQLYRGSYSSARDQERLVAKAFMNSPIRRVREWAQSEMAQAEADAKIHRIREEEFGMG